MIRLERIGHVFIRGFKTFIELFLHMNHYEVGQIEMKKYSGSLTIRRQNGIVVTLAPSSNTS